MNAGSVGKDVASLSCANLFYDVMSVYHRVTNESHPIRKDRRSFRGKQTVRRDFGLFRRAFSINYLSNSARHCESIISQTKVVGEEAKKSLEVDNNNELFRMLEK